MAMKMNLDVVHRGRLLRFIIAPVKCYLSYSLSHSSYSFPLETQRVGHMRWLDKVLLSSVILCLGIIPRNSFSCRVTSLQPGQTTGAQIQSLPLFMGSWILGFGLGDGKERQAKLSKSRSEPLPVSVAWVWAAFSSSSQNPMAGAAKSILEHQKALSKNTLQLLTLNKYTK